MWIVISLLFSVLLFPMLSQSICAKQFSPTASPADDQIKSRAEVFPSLLDHPYTLEVEMSYLSSASFSPDNLRMVTANLDNTARLWDAESKSANFGSQIALVEAGQPITAAAFSPDGRRVVLGVETWHSNPSKSRGEVQIWHMAE